MATLSNSEEAKQPSVIKSVPVPVAPKFKQPETKAIYCFPPGTSEADKLHDIEQVNLFIDQIKVRTEEQPLRIERVWAMPNKWTFTIKPIAQLIAEQVGSGLLINGLWCDPFAGEASPAQVTNDINPERKATYHMDALEFLKTQPSNHFDGVLYDPPYSFRQAKECYDEANIEPPRGYTSMGYWSDVRNELARILKPGGKALCFGWNTMGLGKKRGLKMSRVLLVPHGGNRNDTIVTVELKEVDHV